MSPVMTSSGRVRADSEAAYGCMLQPLSSSGTAYGRLQASQRGLVQYASLVHAGEVFSRGSAAGCIDQRLYSERQFRCNPNLAQT